MSFPISPANNQVALIKGVVYKYNSTKGAWYRSGETTSNSLTANTITALNNLIVGGNTSVTGSILPSSTLTYDLGSANLRWRDLYLSGNTLNLGTASITTDANTGAIALVPAVTASNPNPVGLIITANGVLTTIQTNGGVVYASNIETIVANTGTVVFDSGLMYYAANTANLAMAVNSTQNTNITNADAKAQAAFNAANTVSPLDSYARQTANAAFDKANSANVLAQAAFNAANTVSPLDSYARQTANAAFDKANTAITTSGGTITGSLNVSQNLTVTGNLSVLGTTTSINTEQYEIVDPMIKLGIGNYVTDQIDIGFAGHYNDGANAHTGLFRDFATKDYYLFQGYTPELSGNNNVNISHASFSTANLVASLKGNVIATTITIGGRDQASVDSTQNTNITYVDNKAQAAFLSANTNATNLTNFTELFTGIEVSQNNRIAVVETYVQAAFDKANAANSLAQAAYNQANTGGGADSYARQTANSASSNTIIIQGVDSTQNTNITVADSKAQAAFDKANGANGLAAGAYAAANTKYDSTGGTISGSVTLTGTITGNVSIATNSSQANSIGYLGVPQSNLNPMSANYTLTIGDSGEHLYMVPSSSALTVNIPPNSSVPFPIGTAIVTVLDAAYKSNVVPQTGVTLRLAGNTAGSNVARTLSEYSMASLIKVDTNLWYISGAGVT